MKSVHINTWDKGGAAAAALRLHRAMKKHHLDSKFLVLKKSKDADDVHSFEEYLSNKYGKIWFKILFFLNRVFNQFPKLKPSVFFNKPYSLYRIHNHPDVQEADVVCLHWTVKFIDYPTFFKNVSNKKLIWTMHDMNPFSGGLHYMTSFDDGFNKLEQRYTEVKRKTLVGMNMAIVGPSRWLMNLSKGSMVFRDFRHENIPYCIDQDLWNDSQDSLKKKNILFVADNVLDKRKGFAILLDAIKHLPEAIGLEVLGNINSELQGLGKRQLTYHGFVTDPKELANIYSSVFLYVIPSLEDNLPNTVIESHICGTPVVGFNKTGVADMIQHMENGILVNEVTSAALAKGIEKAIQMKENGDFERGKIAQEASNYYNEENVVNSYLRLIHEMS